MDIKYEQLLSTELDIKITLNQAEKVLQQGWKVDKYASLNIYNNIDWELTNEDDRSWNYSKHSLTMLDKLLSAHSNMPDKIYLLLPAINIALDWTEKHIDEKGNAVETLSKFAWYDMAVGIRALRLAYIIDAARQYNLLSPNQDELLWKALKAHQRYLEDDKNIIFHNNHGYYQAAGQIAMGRRFQDIDSDMAAAVVQGTERLNIMLKQQFTEEGVHREHSPYYHYMVYNTLLSIIKNELINDVSLTKYTHNIESSLSYFITPDQNLVNFGDSNQRTFKYDDEKARGTWQTELMKFVTTNGEIGSLSESKLKVFKEAGYFIVRTNRDLSSLRYDNYSYLAQNAAFHSRTHKHADDLSFVWHDRGHNILIDAGRYGYVGKTEVGSDLWLEGYWYSHPNRLYCESTRAHNTLEFDEVNYPRKGVKPYGSAIGRHHQYDNGLTVLETECKHFESIRRVRVLIYMPNQWLIVYDWFKDNINDKHDVRQWFNFAPEIKLTQINNSYSTKLDDKTELHITNLLDDVTASNIMRGIEEPRLQGWFSPAEKEFIPVDSINYKMHNLNTGAMATLFCFGKKPNVDISENQTNISGRRAKLSWDDDTVRYDITLTRDIDTPIEVSYIENQK